MNTESKKNIFIMCDCYSHGLLFEKDINEDEFYISMYERGFEGRYTSWTDKLRCIWQFIKTGHPYTDMVVLNKDNAKELLSYLEKNLNT
jgi:hypothetical protein